MKNTRGITLIALIITVIVMLILAAVAINMTIGDNGIFRKSDEGAKIYKNAANNEAASLNSVDKEMGDLMEQLKNPQNPMEIVDVIAIEEQLYAVTAGGEVRRATIKEGNIFGTIELGEEAEEFKAIKGKKIVEVQTGQVLVIIRDNEGKVYTMGRNYSGELGNGTTEHSYNELICISDMEGNILHGVKIEHICIGNMESDDTNVVIAMDNNGKVYTWGANNGRIRISNNPRV